MAVYLIDFENVRSDGLIGIEELGNDNEIFIFYSEHADSLTFELHRRIVKSDAKVYYVEAETGTKNALDFQLVSYLGYMLREKPDIPYYIISKDKGFEVVSRFWQGLGVSVDIAAGISLIDKKQQNDETDEDVSAFIQEAFDNNDEREFIEKCIRELTTKSGINNRLAKKYGTTRAGEIYKVIKPLLKNKKG